MWQVFDSAGIDARHVCEPVDWYVTPQDWTGRNQRFLAHADDLLEQVATRCLENAGLAAEDVDQIVTICSTGIATPSLDARLLQRMSFRRDVARLPIFGLGCAGGVTGLARAAQLAEARPGSRVLLLVIELCSLTLRQSDLSKSNILATALFGDGAAAALISTEELSDRAPLLTVEASGEHCWPDSIGVMGWSVEPDGLGVIFSRDIPGIVRSEMRVIADRFLAANGASSDTLAGLICHPGGAKVVEAIEGAMERPPGSLDVERAVLREFGNMSAATVWFVLERRLAGGQSGPHLMSALGPGFTLSFCLVDL
ncbi:MAG: Chalcone synthase [Rhodospirillales bacterium]|nr:Chalcone synthase [Rhodospirillales bacterium]